MMQHDHVDNFGAQIYLADRTIVRIAEAVREVHDQNGEFVCYEGSVVDSTARKHAEQALMSAVEHEQLQKHQFETALDCMSQGLCLFGADGRLIVGNRRFAEIYQIPPERLLPGTPLPAIMALLSAAGHPPRVAQWNSTNNDVADVDIATVIARRQRAVFSQELYNDRVITIALEQTADGGFVATFTDVTEQRLAETRLAFSASHDLLTGLPNRLRFYERLRESLDQTGRGRSCAVLYLDLDHFKAVNDTLGQSVGDSLLKFVAARLRGLVRKSDTIARVGGDEFAILQSDIGSAKDTTYLADRLLFDLAGPHQINSHTIQASVSIGIALVPEDGRDADQLIKSAEIALYRAKALGRNRYTYYEPSMDARMRKRHELKQELSVALQAGEFELHYQPQLDLSRGVVVGFEALLRWRSPTRGLVSPADFIPLAEETGLIVPIGAWVVEAACREAASWSEDIRVAVNVSAIQLADPHLIEMVKHALAISQLPAQRLELEITETVMIADDMRVVATLQALKALGITIAMDDFGAGYSSLSYLLRFPFDRIKIDRSFINEIENVSHSIAIIRAVIGLCENLGITTTAEGVETAQQLSLLRAEHCNEVQGYLISRPHPSAEIPRLIGTPINI